MGVRPGERAGTQGTGNDFLYSLNNSPDSDSCIRRGRPDFPGAAPPKSRRDLRCKAFIAQHIISIRRAADFIHHSRKLWPDRSQ